MTITRGVVGLAVQDRAGALTGHTDADLSVSETTRQRIIDSVPANTTRAYARQLAAFTTWCGARGRAALPATAETLAEYVAGLADADRSPATIEQAARDLLKVLGGTTRPLTHPSGRCCCATSSSRSRTVRNSGGISDGVRGVVR